jgi:hypothetical protein
MFERWFMRNTTVDSGVTVERPASSDVPRRTR